MGCAGRRNVCGARAEARSVRSVRACLQGHLPPGAHSGPIARIFLLQGAIIGIVGTALGLVLGVGIALLVDKSGLIRIDPAVYFIDRLPVHIVWSDIVIITVASVAVAVLATVWPSLTAARLTPVEAIRHE